MVIFRIRVSYNVKDENCIISYIYYINVVYIVSK